MKACVLIPTFDNPRTLRGVVEAARPMGLPVIVIDDGSGAEGRAACVELAQAGLARVHHRPRNGGKGAAVKTGLRLAAELGFTHAAQVDADGQHDLARLPALLEAARARPEALVLGCPRHDESIPRARRIARGFTQLWIELEVGEGVIEDAMVGFRVYPIDATLAANARGDRMDFDVEIPVRMAWRGVPIVNFPVPVRYLTREEGGVSHFQPFWDNLRFSWLHTRLCTAVFFRWLGRNTVRHPARGEDWLSIPERGTVAGIAAVFWFARRLGRPITRALVAVVALFYTLFDRDARAASRDWLTVVEGRRPPLRRVYGHLRRFANIAVDRVFLLAGEARHFTFTRDGPHHLERLERERRGAILLGAHLGSFEAMRLGAKEDRLAINIVGNFSNARMINRVLDRVSDDNRARVIHVEPGDVGFMFHIQERLAAGEMVAILGDRVAGTQPSVAVEFFGRPARFPTGPFQLAALLKCPIYLTFGLFREPNHYALSCEPFAELVELPRKNRQAALEEYVQRYARALEAKARAAPDNWFNFYPFWER